MPKISESQALKLLESHGVPTWYNAGQPWAKPIEPFETSAIGYGGGAQSVKLMDLSERWGTGTPTRQNSRQRLLVRSV
jgi:hypothetical protein